MKICLFKSPTKPLAVLDGKANGLFTTPLQYKDMHDNRGNSFSRISQYLNVDNIKSAKSLYEYSLEIKRSSNFMSSPYPLYVLYMDDHLEELCHIHPDLPEYNIPPIMTFIRSIEYRVDTSTLYSSSANASSTNNLNLSSSKYSVRSSSSYSGYYEFHLSIADYEDCVGGINITEFIDTKEQEDLLDKFSGGLLDLMEHIGLDK